jgi:hypothetical protein
MVDFRPDSEPPFGKYLRARNEALINREKPFKNDRLVAGKSFIIDRINQKSAVFEHPGMSDSECRPTRFFGFLRAPDRTVS